MLVFLMEDREWREIMRPGVPGLLEFIEKIE